MFNSNPCFLVSGVILSFSNFIRFINISALVHLLIGLLTYYLFYVNINISNTVMPT